MFSPAFIFEPGQYDERFHTLDALIESAAKAHPGSLGSENWHSVDGKRINATYYWKDLESLRVFSSDPRHLEVKSQYRQWYKGF